MLNKACFQEVLQTADRETLTEAAVVNLKEASVKEAL